VHHYHLQLKSQSLEYHHRTSPRNKKSETQPSTGKCIPLANAHSQFSGTKETSLSKEYMVKGTRINSKTYVKTLKRLKQQINCNCQTPYYKCCHFSGDSIGFEVFQPPPYSLVLALSDFWLFTALKKHSKRNCFTCDKEVQNATAK